MKCSKFSSSLVALAVTAAFSAAAADDRYVIQVDNANKGLVKALSQKMGAEIKLDADGFFAASFSGKSLSEVKGLLNNPHIKSIEEDPRRMSMSVYNDDKGDATLQQLVPYAVKQSEANQLTLDPNAGMKVCIVDSGLDSSNLDFNWENISGTNDSGTGNWNEHGGPHGTHVAGTVAAADNGFGVVGMAPGVDLHIVKVFNASGWGYSSDLAKAKQVCADNGANIISMSLGGSRANSIEENAFKAFTDAGGLVVAAAGNDGNNARSYPAGYDSVMMIGANDADNNIASFSQFPSCGKGRRGNENTCVEVTAGGVDTLSTYPAGMATSAFLAVDGVSFATSAMENSGSVSGTTYFMGTAEVTDGGANGNICIIDRGNISFHDKVKNCQDSGGLGAIIVNNVSGMLYGTLGETNTTSIPAVGAALEDRAALMAASTTQINIGTSDYGFMSGTSMATPAVSGIAALIWSKNPTCTGSQVREALKATAQDQGASGRDDYFGYGIVKAVAAEAYLANACGDGGVTPPTEPPVADTLTASANKVKGSQVVDLSWTNFAGSSFNVYRDGSAIANGISTSIYTDNIGNKGGGSYSYQVCETVDTTSCTNEVNVIF